MIRHVFIKSCLAIIFLSCSPRTVDLVISNTNIIDPSTGLVRKNADVLISSNIIIEIADHKNHKAGKNKAVIDATGTYSIPGLWDMHTHTLFRKRISPARFETSNLLMLANGVTGFRDMWGDLKFADSVKAKMKAGQIPFQRFTVAGNIVDGIAWRNGHSVVKTPQEGKAIVDSLYNIGADFIKVYSNLDPDVFQSIAKRAKELGIDFAGHVPDCVSAIDASNLGIKSIEHFEGIMCASSTIEDSIINIYRHTPKTIPDIRKSVNIVRHSLFLRPVDTSKVFRLAKTLKKNNTWWCPTITAEKGYYLKESLDSMVDERQKFLPKVIIDFWHSSRTLTNEQRKEFRDFLQREMDILFHLHQQRVKILAGTDFPNAYCLPGYGIHEELRSLVQSGFTPLEALKTATINPAKYLGKEDSLGVIAPNKYADILILRANPLLSIDAIGQIEAVISNGKYFSKNDIEGLKKRAFELNSKGK